MTKKTTIEVNKRQIETQRRSLTLLQLAELALGDDFDPDASYTGTLYSAIIGIGETISPATRIPMVDGLIFNITPT